MELPEPLFDPNLLKFDAEAHAYHYDGVRFVSVTQALRRTGFVDTTHFTDGARTRGEYVHQACALLSEGRLDRASLDPRIAPYVAAYDRFLAETGFLPIHVEHPVAHPVFRYAGTLDLLGVLAGKLAVIDLKTGTLPAWLGLQLAAYAATFKKGHELKRYGLQLKADGAYTLKAADAPDDFSVAMSAAVCANWQLAKGATP